MSNNRPNMTRPTLDFDDNTRTFADSVAQFEIGHSLNSSPEDATTPTYIDPETVQGSLEDISDHPFHPIALTQEPPPQHAQASGPVHRPVPVHSPFCGADSGYLTDSPFTVGSGRSTRTGPDDFQGVFNMSLEDIPVYFGAPTPPPGTFRPVSPADPYRLRHAATQTLPGVMDARAPLPADPRRFFRPASAPIYDIPDEDDELDEEVSYNTERLVEVSVSERQGPLPDLVGSHQADIHQRSQSVPLIEERERRRESIEMVAAQLREIGDEITRTRSPSLSLSSPVTLFAATTSRPRANTTDIVINVRSEHEIVREGGHTIHTIRRSSIQTTTNTSSSYPTTGNNRTIRHRSESSSWIVSIGSLFRTLSGANIERHDHSVSSTRSDPNA